MFRIYESTSASPDCSYEDENFDEYSCDNDDCELLDIDCNYNEDAYQGHVFRRNQNDESASAGVYWNHEDGCDFDQCEYMGKDMPHKIHVCPQSQIPSRILHRYSRPILRVGKEHMQHDNTSLRHGKFEGYVSEDEYECCNNASKVHPKKDAELDSFDQSHDRPIQVLHATILSPDHKHRSIVSPTVYSRQSEPPSFQHKSLDCKCPLCLEACRSSYHHIGDCPFLPIHEKRIISQARNAANILGYSSDFRSCSDSCDDFVYHDLGHDMVPSRIPAECVDHASSAVDRSSEDPRVSFGCFDDSESESVIYEDTLCHESSSESDETQDNTPHCAVASESVVPNQALTPYVDLFHGDHCVHVDLDSGSAENLISHSLVKCLRGDIIATSHSAYPTAHSPSPFVIVGETCLTFSRDGRDFLFKGFVVESSSLGVRAGIPFMELYDVFVRPARRVVTFSEGPSYVYGPSLQISTIIVNAPAACSPASPSGIVEQQPHPATSPEHAMFSDGPSSALGPSVRSNPTTVNTPAACSPASSYYVFKQESYTPASPDLGTPGHPLTILSLRSAVECPGDDTTLATCSELYPLDNEVLESQQTQFLSLERHPVGHVEDSHQSLQSQSHESLHRPPVFENTKCSCDALPVAPPMADADCTSPNSSTEDILFYDVVHHPYTLEIEDPPGRPPESSLGTLTSHQSLSHDSPSRLTVSSHLQSHLFHPSGDRTGLPPGRPPDRTHCIISPNRMKCSLDDVTSLADKDCVTKLRKRTHF
ncbi:uncharacterized protein LOC121411712 [Lytechinus variegatus]|uniref:uncharacterized protein LOC121411712 n=1 Tax=Lytechinus variegatus TaxID=7654 RepID=UPI001BB1578C|nr:uncharacterized protein LOC121411712 [Lytechinus variegatus]